MRSRSALLRSLAVATSLLAAAAPVARAATIIIVNLDGAGEGFNDPTAVAPVGGNPGTTIGAQRLNVFKHAAGVWGGLLPSDVVIFVEAQFDPISCGPTSAVLGFAGPNDFFADFPGADVADTWYPVALANKMNGSDLAPLANDIGITFNSDIDNPFCLGTRSWYYGFDGLEGNDIELLPVCIHEMGHGLGFLTAVNGADGTEFFGSPDIYERFMFDTSIGKHWDEMTDAERATSATNNGGLVWDGPEVKLRAPSFLAPRARLVVNAPPVIAGNLPMGRATWGAELALPGLTQDVVLAVDGTAPTSDACTPLVNAGAVAGKIALVDRSGACTDLVKAQNIQAAGAAGMLYVDNIVATQPPTLRGYDPSLTLTVGCLKQSDGNAIRNQLGSGVNVTLNVDPAQLSGADPDGRVWLYAPNALAGGSSLSHWDVHGYPNLIMEPSLTLSVHDDVDLARELFADIGWQPRAVTGVDPVARAEATLRANAPNPFGAATTIHFALERAGAGALAIYDLTGRRVRRLADGWLEAGPHALTWDGTDDGGRRAPAGTYFYRLTSEGFTSTRRMIMLR